MRRTIVAGAALTASLALAGTAQADTVTTTFDGPERPNGPDWVTGSVNGQYGWLATNPSIDQRVVSTDGNQKFRMSNAYTSGSFGDMPHSKPVLKPAGENEATNVLVNEFTIKSADPAPQSGLFVSVAPDDGQGSRMSQLRFEDRVDGVHVIFTDATFVGQDIRTLDRGEHKIKFETTFVKGDDNDVVRIFIDGDEVKRGASWENYYRFDEERNPAPSDRLIFRAGGSAGETNPAVRGGGFLFDNVTTTSYHVDNPAPLHPVVLPQGPKGDQGDAGATGSKGEQGSKGEAGAIDVISSASLGAKVAPLHGNALRTVHAQKVKDMKFVSVKASLRGKRLSVKGRAVKVDLRSRPAGDYDVQLTAKYRKGGKIVTVRSVRTLKVTSGS